MNRKFRDRIIQRIRNGENIDKLAAELDVTPNYLRIMDGEERSRQNQLSCGPSPKNAIHARICELADAGKPVKEIAKRVNFSQSYVYLMLKRYRPNRARTRKSKLYDRIVEMSDAGRYASQIAAALKVSDQYVREVLSKERPNYPRYSQMARGNK